MREYIRRSNGQIISNDIIYDNPEEYYQDHIHKLKKWGDLDIEAGHWVIADDGYVVQCIRSKVYTTNRHTLYYFKFPMGTFTVTKYKEKFYVSTFYAQFSKPNKSRLGSVDHSKIKKIKFATLVLAGIPIERAYNQIFTLGFRSPHYSFKKGIDLMKDEIVRIELKNQIQSFANKLKDNFSEERLIDELESLLSHSRKGSMAHRQNLELILQLTGYMDNPNSKKKQPDDAEYTEIVPPQLPS